MPTELESTTHPAEPESPTDRARATDHFPYESESEPGYTGASLPTATARCVLRSSADSAADGAAGSTICPDCGGATINGAGLFACQRCAWTGTLR